MKILPYDVTSVIDKLSSTIKTSGINVFEIAPLSFGDKTLLNERVLREVSAAINATDEELPTEIGFLDKIRSNELESIKGNREQRINLQKVNSALIPLKNFGLIIQIRKLMNTLYESAKENSVQQYLDLLKTAPEKVKAAINMQLKAWFGTDLEGIEKEVLAVQV